MSKLLFTALVIAAAGACGGTGNAAIGKTFNYDAPAAPTAGETSAIASAQGGVQASGNFSSAPSADRGFAMVGLALDLASALGGFSLPGMSRASDLNRALRAGSSSAASFDTCTAVTATSVTFNNCTVAESGLTVSVNGSVTSTAGNVAWNVSMNLSGTSSGETFSVDEHAAGTLTSTATTVKGNSTVEIGGSFSGNGQSVSFGLSLAALLDVTYQSSPNFCVTSPSTIEVKRVWTSHPSGQSADQLFADAGIKVSWSGCGAFSVAHSH